MEKYKIIDGMWMNLDHYSGYVVVKNMTTGDEFQYGINRSDNAELNILFLSMIDDKKFIMSENPISVIERSGIIPSQYTGLEIHNGKVIFIDNEKRKTRDRVKERLEQLEEDHKEAKKEKNQIYIKNVERRIYNLEHIEELSDFPFVNLSEVEDQ